jgi:hypothetical protein
MEEEKPTRTYSSRESTMMAATAAASLLGSVAIGNMELSHKVTIIGIAGASGLLLLIGALVRKSRAKGDEPAK